MIQPEQKTMATKEGGFDMRFIDVQDTRKKEAGAERRYNANHSFERHMAKMAEQNRVRKLATIGGVTFTI